MVRSNASERRSATMYYGDIFYILLKVVYNMAIDYDFGMQLFLYHMITSHCCLKSLPMILKSCRVCFVKIFPLKVDNEITGST